MLLPQGQPILPTPRQMKLTVRDLIPSTTTTLASVPYVREHTPATDETGASSVGEGIAKPEVVMEWSDQDAPVRKIAAWVPATSEILADAPTLRGYIDGRLRYMLALREQDEILRGNGVSPDLLGILNTTGIQTQTATNNDVPATIADAIAKVELVDGDANGIVMNPGDYWAQRVGASLDVLRRCRPRPVRARRSGSRWTPCGAVPWSAPGRSLRWRRWSGTSPER